ncbi:hotdog domain-containing protein [Ideonella sp.]|jgi:acyl-CoA hydrolase|uniref:3-aminobutyryl-CoA ammonia lyase n=1 Tax=Ideonella sp. TaxID=1929293 RepID=UPI0037BFE78A
MSDTSTITSMIRLRLGSHDAHYAGNLVDGAKMLQLFGDVATELLIRSDGDEGLFVAYDKVEFLAPVMAGDFIEAHGRITQMGKSSRKMEFEARKVISAAQVPGQVSAADVLDPPVVVCRASGTCVVPVGFQRLAR